jgi:hypothetical protein
MVTMADFGAGLRSSLASSGQLFPGRRVGSARTTAGTSSATGLRRAFVAVLVVDDAGHAASAFWRR